MTNGEVLMMDSYLGNRTTNKNLSFFRTSKDPTGSNLAGVGPTVLKSVDTPTIRRSEKRNPLPKNHSCSSSQNKSSYGGGGRGEEDKTV
jgi:hypothetical protein